MSLHKNLQKTLKKAGLYSGKIDGKFGEKTYKAVEIVLGKEEDTKRGVIRAVQTILNKAKINVGAADGLFGPMTESGIEQYLGIVWLKDKDVAQLNSTKNIGSDRFPTSNRIRNFYGEPGDASRITRIEFPYKMRLAWDLDTTVTRTSVNKKCKREFQELFEFTLEHYGKDGIRELDLDLFGGLLNVRRVRGGKSWSNHAYGCAIDLSPQKNGLRTSWKKSQFSAIEYKPFFDKVNELGGMNLAETLNRDAMHFSFVRTTKRHKLF